MSYQNIKNNSKNTITQKLIDIILEKKTNLCVSADVDTGEELIKLVHQVGSKICALKTHADLKTRMSREGLLGNKMRD